MCTKGGRRVATFQSCSANSTAVTAKPDEGRREEHPIGNAERRGGVLQIAQRRDGDRGRRHAEGDGARRCDGEMDQALHALRQEVQALFKTDVGAGRDDVGQRHEHDADQHEARQLLRPDERQVRELPKHHLDRRKRDHDRDNDKARPAQHAPHGRQRAVGREGVRRRVAVARQERARDRF